MAAAGCLMGRAASRDLRGRRSAKESEGHDRELKHLACTMASVRAGIV